MGVYFSKKRKKLPQYIKLCMLNCNVINIRQIPSYICFFLKRPPFFSVFLSLQVLKITKSKNWWTKLHNLHYEQESGGKYPNLSFGKLPVEILGSQKLFSCRETPPRAGGLASHLEFQAPAANEGRTLGWMNQHSSSKAAPNLRTLLFLKSWQVFLPSSKNPQN